MMHCINIILIFLMCFDVTYKFGDNFCKIREIFLLWESYVANKKKEKNYSSTLTWWKDFFFFLLLWLKRGKVEFYWDFFFSFSFIIFLLLCYHFCLPSLLLLAEWHFSSLTLLLRLPARNYRSNVIPPAKNLSMLFLFGPKKFSLYV